jgi:branched-chain amino acid transport system permease protein
LVEQNFHLAIDTADQVYVLSKGAVVWEGLPQELESAEEVKQTYLGV